MTTDPYQLYVVIARMAAAFAGFGSIPIGLASVAAATTPVSMRSGCG